MASDSSFIALFLFSIFASLYLFAGADVLIEDGYTVKTVIDGHKLKRNPRSVMLRPGSSDLVVLESPRSAFYIVPFPASNDSVAKLLSGTGEGYSDGKLETAKFAKPQSFAMDLRGNIYVADVKNSVIRKITDTGVSTIAGVNNKTGKADGQHRRRRFRMISCWLSFQRYVHCWFRIMGLGWCGRLISSLRIVLGTRVPVTEWDQFRFWVWQS